MSAEHAAAAAIDERIADIPGLRLGIGTVTAKNDGTRTVSLRVENGTTVLPNVRRVRGYTPTVGDVVHYLADPAGNWLVLG